jgi:hypothetical protein
VLADNRERLESLTRTVLAAETLDAGDAYDAPAGRGARAGPSTLTAHETNC